MSETGKEEWVSFNQHLADLRLQTLAAAKSNATIASQLAVATVEDIKNVPLDKARLAADTVTATATKLQG